MKKLVIASAAMGGAALIAFGASGTFAAFNDAADVSGSAGAGTLVLDGTSNGGSVAVDAAALRPGQSASSAYYFANGGDMAGDLQLTLTGLADSEGPAGATCSGDEAKTDTNGCTDATKGEFSSVATITAGLTIVDGAEKCTVDTVAGKQLVGAPNSSIASIQNQPVGPNRVDAGKGACLVITITLPTEAGNAVQGDSASFSVDAVLSQV